MKMKGKAPAKINLSLRVFEQRQDGFHRVETIMMKVSFCDLVEVQIREGNQIRVWVEGHPELSNENNLAAKAARQYLKRAGIEKDVQIQIQKRIFTAAGLGGGSSDAACTLKLLHELLKARITEDELSEIAANLGSDVPFFLEPCELGLGLQRGEKILPWPSLSKRLVLLVNPGIAVSTKEAYQVLDRSLTWNASNDNSFALVSVPKNWNDLLKLMEWGNDLQEVVEKIHPEIRKIRDELVQLGAQFAQMSGSGATVFGLFEDQEAAKKAYVRLRMRWQTVLTETGI